MPPRTRSMSHRHHHGRLRPQSEARQNSPNSTPPPSKSGRRLVADEDADDVNEDNKENLVQSDETGTKRELEPGDSADDIRQKKVKTERADVGEQNEDEAKDDEPAPETLEEGLVYFFFRPKVMVEEVSSIDDVQKLYMVLRPLPSATKDELAKAPENLRMMIVPKKALPTGGARLISLVTKVHATMAEITEQLEAESYQTKTRGERTLGSARPIVCIYQTNSSIDQKAEGVYALTKEDKSHYLSYILTAPADETDVDQEFGVHKEGRYIVSARNPKYPATGGIPVPKGPEYPKEILEEFHDRRWIPLEPKHMDYENCEILFISSRHGVSSKQEDILMLEDENERRIDMEFGGDAAKAVFSDLHLKKGLFVDSDLKGTWA